jgi:hypothetical protein
MVFPLHSVCFFQSALNLCGRADFQYLNLNWGIDMYHYEKETLCLETLPEYQDFTFVFAS